MNEAKDKEQEIRTLQGNRIDFPRMRESRREWGVGCGARMQADMQMGGQE